MRQLLAPSIALAFIGAGGAISASAAPFLAIGDSAELFLTGTVGLRMDDNVFLSPSEIDDTVLTVIPGAELVFGNGSLSRGKAYVQEEIVHYFDLDNLDDELFSGGFDYTYDDSKLRLALTGSFRQTNENTREVAGGSFLVLREVTRLGGVGEVRVSAKTKVGVGANFNSTNYKRAGYYDYDIVDIPVSFYYELTPKIDLSAGVSYRQTEISQSILDTKDYYYNVGARGQFTPKLSGQMSVGLRQRKFEDLPASMTDDSDDMLGYDASLNYEVTPKTVARASLSQDYATGAFGESLDDSSASVGINSALSEQFSVDASLTYRDINYSKLRADEYLVGTISGSYIVNSYLRLSAYYSYSDNDSSVTNLNFERNVVGFVANLRY